jgi:pyruvate ferredoxin oxidoreductase alpha subunit
MKIGVISLKVFRPFPVAHLRKAFKNCKIVVVFDREVGYGYEGILAYELKAALYGGANQPYIKGFIVCLGGRDVIINDLKEGVLRAIEAEKTHNNDTHTEFLGTRLEELGFKKPEAKS